MRSLVTDKSEVSKKVKKILGTDDSWARPPGSRRSSKRLKRESVDESSVSQLGKVTLPSTSLLQPYEVSEKVQELARAGKLGDAIEYVTNLPLDALNVQAWNTLIWEASKAKRFRVAWDLYNQMKKKGFEPSALSYKTMLNGLNHIGDFQIQTLAIDRAHKLYASFIQYAKRLRKEKPNHPELNPVPINSYLSILAKAGLRSQMWDTFYAMDKEGPMAPDAVTYSSMLQHLDSRPVNDTTSPEEWRHRVASDAALIWRLMLSSERKSRFEIDSHALSAVLRLLAKGQAKEQDLAFEIVQEHLGLSYTSSFQGENLPNAEAPALNDRNSLTQFTLQAALDVCRLSNKPERTMAYMRQVMEMSEEKSVIDIHHMDQLFTAYFEVAKAAEASPKDVTSCDKLRPSGAAAMSSLKWLLSHAATYFSVDRGRGRQEKYLWPTIRTYNLILATCRECRDWNSTYTVLEMMTGTKLRSPPEEETVETAGQPYGKALSIGTIMPSFQRRQFFRPTAESLFNIMHCAQGYAMQHNRPSTAHECLSAINNLGGAELLSEVYDTSRKVLHDLLRHPHPKEKVARLDTIAKRDEERRKYWAVRASAIVPALFRIATRSGGWNRREYERAIEFRAAATEILNTQRHELGGKGGKGGVKDGKRTNNADEVELGE